jgi:alpha-L-arabinofuranosidase
VLRPMADALEAMGVKLFRAGGTVAQSQFWQDWRGPLWERTPMVWRNNEVSGFGPFETIDLCNAAGILPILTTEASGRTAEEMADLVEYS